MTSTLLLWTPRMLGVAMALFVAAFAADVFVEGLGFWKTFAALLIHLLPAGIVAAIVAVAWRWPVAGGLLFLAAGVGYAVMARDHLSWILVLSGPLWLIGTLFILGGTRAAR
jgi:hypothetical protein